MVRRVYQCFGLLGYPLSMVLLLCLVHIGCACAWACQGLAAAEERVETFMAVCGAATAAAMALVAWRLLS